LHEEQTLNKPNVGEPHNTNLAKSSRRVRLKAAKQANSMCKETAIRTLNRCEAKLWLTNKRMKQRQNLKTAL